MVDAGPPQVRADDERLCPLGDQLRLFDRV
jgi:hypothetical protein